MCEYSALIAVGGIIFGVPYGFAALGVGWLAAWVVSSTGGRTFLWWLYHVVSVVIAGAPILVALMVMVPALLSWNRIDPTDPGRPLESLVLGWTLAGGVVAVVTVLIAIMVSAAHRKRISTATGEV